MRKNFVFILILIVFGTSPNFIQATETQPWFGNFLEFEWRTKGGADYYTRIDTVNGVVNKSSTDAFLNLSLTLPLNHFCAEVEFFSASTRYQNFTPTDFKATVRCLRLNDIIGDPFSATIGLSLIVPNHHSVKDVGLGYHGDVEIEGHLAIGKEIDNCGLWNQKFWAVLFLGQANRGCPWTSLEVNFEQLFSDRHSFRLFVRGLIGIGNRPLDLSLPFNGYGFIKHRSIDAGFAYLWESPCFSTLTLEYFGRVYGCNFPQNNHCLSLTLFIPFSL